jgi:hypothetical protein
VDCSFFREVSVHLVSAGTGFFFKLQISNDNTNWSDCPACTSGGNVALAQFGTAGVIYNYSLLGARFFRIQQVASQTSGTTTLVAYASQQATPKLYQSVTGSVTIAAQVGVVPQPSPSNGFTLYHSLVSAASTNATSVKGAAGQIGTLILTNSSATWAYFKLVNKTSAPTVGTDTAIINIGVAPNTTQDCSTSFAGLRMTTGIAYYVSGGPSLTDNTALPLAGTFLVNLTYV